MQEDSKSLKARTEASRVLRQGYAWDVRAHDVLRIYRNEHDLSQHERSMAKVFSPTISSIHYLYHVKYRRVGLACDHASSWRTLPGACFPSEQNITNRTSLYDQMQLPSNASKADKVRTSEEGRLHSLDLASIWEAGGSHPDFLPHTP